MQNWLRSGNRVGLFLVLLFVVTFIWYWLRPVNQDLHLKLFEMWFYGFTGMNVVSFVLGVIQSYVWGYIGAALWNVTGCWCCKK